MSLGPTDELVASIRYRRSAIGFGLCIVLFLLGGLVVVVCLGSLSGGVLGPQAVVGLRAPSFVYVLGLLIGLGIACSSLVGSYWLATGDSTLVLAIDEGGDSTAGSRDLAVIVSRPFGLRARKRLGKCDTIDGFWGIQEGGVELLNMFLEIRSGRESFLLSAQNYRFEDLLFATRELCEYGVSVDASVWNRVLGDYRSCRSLAACDWCSQRADTDASNGSGIFLTSWRIDAIMEWLLVSCGIAFMSGIAVAAIAAPSNMAVNGLLVGGLFVALVVMT